MNGNIKVINEHLWEVNFYYVAAGWVRDLWVTPDVPFHPTDMIASSAQGILIMNTACEEYPVISQMVPRVMAYTEERLNHELQYLQQNENTLDCWGEFLLDLLQIEHNRRLYQARWDQQQEKEQNMTTFDRLFAIVMGSRMKNNRKR